MIDWTKILEQAIVTAPATIAAIGAFVVSLLNRTRAKRIEKGVADVHQATNGMTAALVKSAGQTGALEGHAQGVADEKIAQAGKDVAYAQGTADEQARKAGP